MSTRYSPKINTDGLILCLDPISSKNTSSIFTDLTTTNCNGTLSGSAAFSNSELVFNGTSSYVNFASNNILTSADTIEIWFKLNSTNNGVLFYAGDDTYNSTSWDWSFFPYAGNFLGRALPGGGGTNLGTLSSYLNNWFVLTMVRSAGLFYKNGLSLTATTVGSTISKPIRLGKAGSTYFSGSVGPIKIYNRALSASEIYANYNAVKGRFGL